MLNVTVLIYHQQAVKYTIEKISKCTCRRFAICEISQIFTHIKYIIYTHTQMFKKLYIKRLYYYKCIKYINVQNSYK